MGLAETAVRRIETDPRKRGFDTYLPGAAGGAGRHVLLAACRDDEEAKEFQGGGATRGAFSYFLGETLRTAGGANYRELFSRARALVRGQVQRQSPQLEATDHADLGRPFLGGAIRPTPRYFLATHGRGWSIDAGRVHGIPAVERDDPTELALYALTAADADLDDPTKALAAAKVVRTLSATSEVEILSGTIDPAVVSLKAVITRLPTPRLRIRVEGEEVGVALARAALAESLFVCEPGDGETADYRLLAQGGQYLIAKPDDDRPLVEQIDGHNAASAKLAVERLEHIERWKATAELDNPGSSIDPGELLVEIVRDGKVLTGDEARLEYARGADEEWVNPEVTIRLKNTGRRVLHFALLDLTQTFGVVPLLNHVGCQRLEAGQETFATGGEPIQITVPDELWERGVSELKDIVKVVVSTSEFDARRLAQEELGLPREDRGATRGRGASGTLDRLLERVQTRHMSTGSAGAWTTGGRSSSPSRRYARSRPTGSRPVGR